MSTDELILDLHDRGDSVDLRTSSRPGNQVIECFLVKIFRGRVELARLVFRIKPRAILGRVKYTGSGDLELDAIIARIMRRRWWDWHALSVTLIAELTMATGGRYVPRFHRTPAPDGRGQDERLRRCFRERATV